MSLRTWLASAAVAALGLASTAYAEEWSVLGSRYRAMGGAGVAVVDDSFATHWNPGALAFSEGRSSWGTPIELDAAAIGDILRDVDEISELVDDATITTLLSKMQNGQALTTAELRSALDLAQRLNRLSEVGEGFAGSPDVGFSWAVGRLALTANLTGDFGIDPDFDPLNLALNTAGSAAAQVTNAVGAGADRSGQFSGAGSQALADLIAASFGAWSQNQAEEFIFQAEQAGLNPDDADIAALLQGVAGSTAEQLTSDLSANGSGVDLRALLTQEIGLSYAHPLFGDTIGLGANVRYVRGTTYTSTIRYDSGDSTSDLIDELTDSHNRETTQNVGLDLGLLVRPSERLRIGVVARNLNAPEFDTELGDDIELDPQVRAGVAYRLLPGWIVAADVDVTENESITIAGYDSRMLAVGTEYRAGLGPTDFAIRAGAYTNLAEDVADTLTLTAGLGVRLWKLRLDLAAGTSPHFEDIDADGHDWPSQINLSVALNWSGEF